MTDQPGPRWPNRLIAAVILSMCAQLLGTGIFVWTASHARQENCDRVAEAFDAYTDALAEVSHADEATVDEFRDAYRPALAECT